MKPTGQLIGSIRDERQVNNRGTQDREMIHHRLYRQKDQSFLLITERRLVGCSTTDTSKQPMESIHAIYSVLSERESDRLIGQFLRSHKTV